MDSRFKLFIEDVKTLLTSRTVIMGIVFFIGFYAVVLRLFDLQIVNGESLSKEENKTSSKTIDRKSTLNSSH